MKYLILSLLILLLSYCSKEIDELTVCNESILNESNQISFSTEAWQQAHEEKRGQMILDLARHHKLKNIEPEKIRRLLGQNTCYINYDDEPCYKIKINQKTQYLAFPVAHSGNNIGKISGAYVRSNPSTLSGCSFYK